MSYVFAFDLSLNSTGYSVFDENGNLKDMGTIDTNQIDKLEHKLKNIADVVYALKSRFKPGTVVMERGFSRFNAVTQKLFRVVGVVNYIFWDVEQIYIPAKTVRKLICKQGNIKKDDFFLYVQKKYRDLEFRNNDEADSFALGLAYFKEKKVKNNDSRKTGKNKR